MRARPREVFKQKTNKLEGKKKQEIFFFFFT